MKTSLWTPYISEHTINAICWTLIHSLWIGMGIALLCGLVIATTRKASANLRYRLLCSLLLLFVASVGVTFYLEMQSALGSSGVSPVIGTGAAVHHENNIVITVANAPVHLSLFETVVSFLNRYTDVIFIAWLLFFVLKSLKMVSGLLYIQRIRNYKTQEVAEEFKQKIEMFSRQIGIGRAVRLVQSELVKVPVAVGWLKPMILLPIGIIFQLSTEQLASILWHELAHIRRRDYLVNILQGLVETVFFFNPGLLWLSALIRAEREACCDDMVLSRMDRKANYLEALLAFGFEDNSKASLAMGIGSGNQLRDRLKRMVSQENKRLSVAEKVVLGVGLILLSAFTGMPKATTEVVKHVVHIISKESNTTIPKAPAVTTQSKPVRTQVTADTTRRRIDTSTRFTSILFKSDDADLGNSDMQAKDIKGNTYHFVVANGKLVQMELNGKELKGDELVAHQYLVDNIRAQLATKRRAKPEDIQAFIQKYKKDQDGDGGDNPDAWKQLKMMERRLQEQKKGGAGKFDEHGMKISGDDAEAARNRNLELIKIRMQADSINYTHDLDRARGVINDLVKDGVVKNAASVQWFGLSNTEFIVNGQNEPAALLEKLKKKYGVHEDYGLYYGPVKMTGRGVFIGDSADWAQRNNKERQQRAQKQPREKEFGSAPQPKGAWPLDKEMAMQQEYRKDPNYTKTAKPGVAVGLMIDGVITDLVNENILNDRSTLSSFYLTNSSLMVNGVKQPESIHDKLKVKYLKNSKFHYGQQILDDPNFGLHYDAVRGGMGLGITDVKPN